MNGNEEPDPIVVAIRTNAGGMRRVKPTNKAGRPVAEPVERRVGTKGNASQHNTRRAQNRESVTQALDRVRQAARTRKKERFTALLHHVDVDLLRIAFLALQRGAAPGADGLTWRDYEADLEPRLVALHKRVQRGSVPTATVSPDVYTKGGREAAAAGDRHAPIELHSVPTDLWDRLKSSTRFTHYGDSGSSF